MLNAGYNGLVPVITLQIRQIVFYLLLTQLSESGPHGPLNTFIAKQVICGRTNNTCFERSASVLILPSPQRNSPISTVSPFISPSIVSFSVKSAMCTASSSSKSSLYLFSRKVFALVALFPIAVAFHGK